MKLIHSMFHNDHLQLSRWDLVKLFFGRTLKISALVIECRKKKNP